MPRKGAEDRGQEEAATAEGPAATDPAAPDPAAGKPGTILAKPIPVSSINLISLRPHHGFPERSHDDDQRADPGCGPGWRSADLHVDRIQWKHHGQWPQRDLDEVIEFGQPKSGTATVTASDGKGGAVPFEFRFL